MHFEIYTTYGVKRTEYGTERDCGQADACFKNRETAACLLIQIGLLKRLWYYLTHMIGKAVGVQGPWLQGYRFGLTLTVVEVALQRCRGDAKSAQGV